MDNQSDTVLLVCSDEACAHEILEKLVDDGFHVIGPTPSAGLALALAAQCGPTVALVARPPTGKRNARELARDLMAHWGVGSVILDAAQDVEDDDLIDTWTPRPGQLARLRRTLGHPAETSVGT